MGPLINALFSAGSFLIGALLFGVVALARRAGVDPEAALRATTARFRDDFMDKENVFPEVPESIGAQGALPGTRPPCLRAR